MPEVYPIAIIGGGAAGVMACLRSALNNDRFIFFPGTPKDKKKSRAFWVKKIENIPGFFGYKRAVEEPHLETLKWIEESPFNKNFTWMKNRGVSNLQKNDKGQFLITDNQGEEFLATHVVLCTGGMDCQPKINGEIQPIFPFANAQSVDYCIRCDGHHVMRKETVIIGHGSTALWVGIILHERYSPPSMTILTNGEKSQFDEEGLKIADHYGFRVIEEKIQKVLGDPRTGVLEGFLLENGEEVISQMAFVSLGMTYYNELAKNLGAEIDKVGRVVTDKKGESTVTSLFIAGDLKSGIKNQVYTAWDSAVDTIDEINSRLRRKKREAELSS